ncbi:GntR family transcriptional regulator [Bosea sp. PAMC 26642]|uniref:GntR family transcriptional regulator n=1 Tax=Bosea sp. (strain PAMC 26642) TaxID=1792307 RepID=UPI0009E9F0B4|nr:GntR family transcriptional regulator [Bosea sp. PAMC 26642]
MTVKTLPRVLVRTTVSEQTYEDIKARIIDRELPPGARLNIDALARELSVSSTPIREALARLEREQLVSLELYAGYSVLPPPSPEYLAGLMEFRILWEGHCALVGAPKMKSETLRSMEQSFRKMSGIRRLGTKYRDYRKFTDEDARFHQAIIDSAENPAMTKIYANLHIILLQSRLYLTRSASGAPSKEVLSEHEAILSAFLTGDGIAAQKAISDHLRGGGRRLQAVRASTPQAIADPRVRTTVSL